MKTRTTKSLTRRTLAIAMGLIIFATPVFAQGGNPPVKTNTKILYHDGPVMQNGSNVYLIWYGNWSGVLPGNTALTQQIVTEFTANLGGSPYFKINVDYRDLNGFGPNGVVIYSGTANDAYSKGSILSVLDVQSVINDLIFAGWLPLDGAGIYVVLSSSDVASSETGFCQPNAPPHHGMFLYQNNVQIKYAFIGNPVRCPSTAAPYLSPPTPNNDFGADGIVNNLAAVMSAMVSNPTGTSWFDRYGLENSTKCQGMFGPTYATPNGSQANIRLGTRHYLLQENWVNSTRKGYCGMSAPQP